LQFQKWFSVSDVDRPANWHRQYAKRTVLDIQLPGARQINGRRRASITAEQRQN
jgi:hypothetical protein